MTLSEVTKEDFEACLGQSFGISAGGSPVVDVELIEVTGREDSGHSRIKAARSGQSRRESFSAVFRAPRNWCGPQYTYHVAHQRLGDMQIFLVPIGPDEKGMKLEAVFNFD